MTRIATTLIFALAAAAGCVDANPGYAPGPALPDQCLRGVEVSETFEGFERPDKLDILMVVDNSGDVVGEQERMARALPSFLETLDERDMSVRLGVVTADASAAPGLAPAGTLRDGCAQNAQAYASSESSGWIEAAACNVVQGEQGRPRQQALEVLQTSVVDRPGNLDDFFRPDARLLAVVLSNEDDCSSPEDISGEGAVRNACAASADSLTEVDEMVERIRAEANTPEGISLAVVSGAPSERDDAGDESVRPVCQSTLGAAYPANRLYAAAEAFGERGHFQSLCTDDLSFGLDEIARALAEPGRTTLCPAQKLVHEPLGVEIPRAGQDPDDVALGESGFWYLGATPTCENGALSLAAAPLAAAESVDVRYCVDS